MNATRRPNYGYSLIELIVVLTIVGILSIVGVSMIGNRPSGAVRGILDELEGVLFNAHKRAVATGQDVILTSSGDWAVPNFMTLTFTGATGGDAWALAHGVSNNIPTGIQREHLHGGVVTVATANWWGLAQGTGANANTDLNTVHPFDTTGTAFHPAAGNSILTDDTLNLFKGGVTAGTLRISGTNKRFTTTSYIKVVGLTTNGLPIPGGPMGVLVVQANGATIYKFYTPGIRNGDGTWRRL
jgi:prepilin-type N-terminal cleavage/methylation domain-containing protein